MHEQLTSDFLSLVQVDHFEDIYAKDIGKGLYFGYPLKAIVQTERRLKAKGERPLAYFSMEYGLASSFYNRMKTEREVNPLNKTREHEIFSNFSLADYFFTLKLDGIIDLPIYSGGLGVLAGDTMKTMSDYRLPAVGIGMLWHTGYFKQKFWFKYGQVPEEMRWDLESYPGLIPLKNIIKISLKSQTIFLKLWKYYVYNYTRDYAIPLILLDSNVPENSDTARRLTDRLYRSESMEIQILQRIILGMGGIVALDELGYHIDTYHLNEGHAVFAFIEKARGLSMEKVKELGSHFVYTCHTPVSAGHDRYPLREVGKVLIKEDYSLAELLGKEGEQSVNLTLLAMNSASRINAVSLRHQQVMHLQFPTYQEKIQYVTNGVHHHTWISERFQHIFEQYAPVLGDVKANPMALEKVQQLHGDNKFRKAVWDAHQKNKQDFCHTLEKWRLREDVFTICWARRIAGYKRPNMLLQDAEVLLRIAREIGPLQVILAGKAHPQDNIGFTYINEMLDKIDELNKVYEQLKIVVLENYDISLAKMLVSSVDVWLNNPLPPFEASGTSGMKAILNGVLQLTTLDGWVVEAEQDEIGRIFGYRFLGDKIGSERDLHMKSDSQELYRALEDIVKKYYDVTRAGTVNVSAVWIDYMINCIATGSRFNTYRMLDDYKERIWQRDNSVHCGCNQR